MTIQQQFKIYKIRQLQLDPYGICNAKCWFCPVKYKGNPENGKQIMSPDLLRKIIKNLIDERDKKDGLVHKEFGQFYTAHYNEILLYPHFEELLKICQEYKISFTLLSNGIPLIPSRIDLIQKYPGVVNGICLNIPAFDAETWSVRSGINIKQFDKLVSNVNYAIECLPTLVNSKSFSIQINGVTSNSFDDTTGWLKKGPEFPTDINLDINNGELSKQKTIAKKLFPKLKIFTISSLVDRVGLLDHIITNKSAIKRNLQKGDITRQVFACGDDQEIGGRPFSWIHVNSSGKVFLCCNDYDMEIQFGDFKTQELKDFWGNEFHQQKVQESFNTICRECKHAKFKNSNNTII